MISCFSELWQLLSYCVKFLSNNYYINVCTYLLDPEDCLSCTVAIHRKNVGASLVEINEGMSQLLDKQVDTQNKNLEIKIPGFTQALVKCVMKIKEEYEKNDCRTKYFFIERRTS